MKLKNSRATFLLTKLRTKSTDNGSVFTRSLEARRPLFISNISKLLSIRVNKGQTPLRNQKQSINRTDKSLETVCE